MSTLQLEAIPKEIKLAQPEDQHLLNQDSPALAFLTDFHQTKPLMIESSVSAVEADTLMKKAHVRLKFVVDKEENLLGVITSNDLIEREFVKRTSKTSGRDQISVTELMTPRAELKAFEMGTLAKASIGEVIKVLKQSGHRHGLVVDSNEGAIRGIFSISEISRKLGMQIDIVPPSEFYKVFSPSPQRGTQ